jgi:hypothetical protein
VFANADFPKGIENQGQAMITTYQELHDYLKDGLREDEDGYWTYMVFCTRSNGELCFCIKDVSFSSVYGVHWSVEPDHPFASVEEDQHNDDPEAWKEQLRKNLQWMANALGKPVVDEDALDEDIDKMKSK